MKFIFASPHGGTFKALSLCKVTHMLKSYYISKDRDLSYLTRENDENSTPTKRIKK